VSITTSIAAVASARSGATSGRWKMNMDAPGCVFWLRGTAWRKRRRPDTGETSRRGSH
jgi:hypothetical protein